MTVEPSWRMNWPQELKPLPRPIQQQIDDGFWSPDTRLQDIAGAWNAYMHQPSGYPSPTRWKTLADLLDALTEEQT